MIKVDLTTGAITEKAFKKNLERYKDHGIIGYCTISYRSGELAKKLGKKGIKMLNLKGGLLAWVHEGGKVYDQHGEIKRVHVSQKSGTTDPRDMKASGRQEENISWVGALLLVLQRF